jgi:hypothetical protein
MRDIVWPFRICKCLSYFKKLGDFSTKLLVALYSTYTPDRISTSICPYDTLAELNKETLKKSGYIRIGACLTHKYWTETKAAAFTEKKSFMSLTPGDRWRHL